MAERTERFPATRARLLAAHHRRVPPVPAHILAQESLDENMDETFEALVNSAAAEDREGDRRARREEEDSADDMSLDEEEDEWEASGDSSGAFTTDEDESADERVRPVVLMSSDSESGDDSMDVDEEEDEDERHDEGPSMEMLGGDDALEGDTSTEHAAAPEILGGDDALDSDSDDGMSRMHPLGGDEALDSESVDEGERKSAEPPNGSLSDVDDGAAADESFERPLGGDDALDSETSLSFVKSPHVNGNLSSSSRSPTPTRNVSHERSITPTPNGRRSSSHSLPRNGPTSPYSPSHPVSSVKKAIRSSQAGSDLSGSEDAAVGDFDDAALNGQHSPAWSRPSRSRSQSSQSRSASPATGMGEEYDNDEVSERGSDGSGSGLLGGDDALDSDSD